MNKTGSFLTVFMIIALFLTGVAAASDSYSVKVSCTIPAVPGLNVPIVEEEKPVIPQETMVLNSVEQEARIKEEGPLVLVKTVYAR